MEAQLAAAKARGRVVGGDRGWRPAQPPCTRAAAAARAARADCTVYRLLLEIESLREKQIKPLQVLARKLAKGDHVSLTWSTNSLLALT
jgi:hypothetical protein